MTWFKVDDGLPDHPKVIALGKDQLPAMGLWTLVGAWAARYGTGGSVPEAIVRRHDPRLRLARKLVEVGLWKRELLAGNPHFNYHDWYDIQPSQVEVERKKEQNRERQRRFRLRRAGIDPDEPGPGETPQLEDEQPTSEDLAGPAEHSSRNGARNALPEALVTSPCPDLTRPKGKKNLSSTEPPREDVDRLCTHLADRIATNTGRRPTITQRWRDSARLLLDKDLPAEPDPLALALRLADWATNDEFWRTNVLSMPTFRDKFDQLRLKARREWEQTHTGRTTRRTTDDKRDAVAGLVAEVFGTNGATALRPDLRSITGGATP